MIPTDWTPHHRASDAELVGYLTEDADGTVPRTLFGAPLAPAGPRTAAVAVLESRGLVSLADPWLLRRDDGEEVRVLVLAAYPGRVLVAEAPYGVVDPASATVVLDVPEGAGRLRPLR